MTFNPKRFGYVTPIALSIIATAGITAPATAAVTYSYSNTSPNVSFQYIADDYITSYVEKTYAELKPTGTTLFDYAEFCPAGTLCGHAGSYQFTENFDSVYLVNLRDSNANPVPVTVIDPVTGQPRMLPTVTVNQDSTYAPGTFVTPGTYSAFTSGARLVISNSAVPEPATWAMMTLGFGAVGFATRRKKVSTPIRFA